MQAATVVNVARSAFGGGKGTAAKPTDFMPKFGHEEEPDKPEEAQEQTVEQATAILAGIAGKTWQQ